MFRLQRNLKKSNNFVSLQQQNPLLTRTFNLRFHPSAFYSTKKINLPKINDEKVVTTLFTKYDRLDSFIGDKAYNYYAVRALKLKVPGAIRKDFTTITSKIISREFLTEIAVKCELDKLMLQHTKTTYHLGEMMEAYCSAMLFNGMEEEMKKFTSDIVDYYFEKNKKKTDKVVKEEQNKTIEEKKDKQKGMVEMKENDDKKDDKKDDKITNKVVKETNKEEKQQKGVKINKNDDNKNIKENKVSTENSKKKKKKKKGTNDKTIKEEKKKEIILSIKGQ